MNNIYIYICIYTQTHTYALINNQIKNDIIVILTYYSRYDYVLSVNVL